MKSPGLGMDLVYEEEPATLADPARIPKAAVLPFNYDVLRTGRFDGTV